MRPEANPQRRGWPKLPGLLRPARFVGVARYPSPPLKEGEKQTTIRHDQHQKLTVRESGAGPDVTRASSVTNEWIEPPPEVVERVVEYSFIELARHRARLRSALFAIPEVVSLAVDEELNRIVIGLEDLSGKAAVLALVTDLGIPVETISFSTRSRARMLSMSSGEASPDLSLSEGVGRLDRSIPDGRLRGGYQVQAEGGQTCTLGFTAVLDNGGLVFVSNSHCSKIPWRTDFGDWGQPDTDDVVGIEVEDPPVRKCWKRWKGFFPIRVDCRDSDASMMAVDTDIFIALGEIGRTERRDRDCGGGYYPGRKQCTVRLDSVPIITITHTRYSSDDGDVLDKIGSVTGWTWGNVTGTCEDVRGQTDVVIECADIVDFVTTLGDSGAPVFKYYSDGTAEFRGIVFGVFDERDSDGYGRKGVFQDLEQIERDLGALTVTDPGVPSVRIRGRDLVPPEKNAPGLRAGAGCSRSAMNGQAYCADPTPKSRTWCRRAVG